MSGLYVSEINSLSVTSFADIFSYSVGCLFDLLVVSFAVQKLLSSIRSSFCFYFHYSRRWIQKGIAVIYVSVLPLFPSTSFIVSGLTFRSVVHVEFIFVCSFRECFTFILLYVAVQFFQHHLLKKFFSPLYILASFVIYHWP